MRTVLAALTLLSLAAPGAAHHGWSSYDESKPITLTGPLRAVTWSNPHGGAQMSWQGKTWDVVLAPTQRMEARGLAASDIDNGQRITLTGYARRDGTAEMRVERIRAGGKTVELR